MRRFVFLTLVAAAAWPQARPDLPPAPSYEVKRAARPIVVDGKPDEATWKAAGTLELQFPWKQQTGAMQKTVARILWDDQFLYVAYDCEDTDVVAHYTERDDPTYKDDAVEFFVNPDPSQSWYYGMEMNARGVLYDYFYVFPKTLLKRVNFGGVQLATHVRGTLNQTGDKDRGWSLEVAIPWANFEELGKKLGLIAGRRNGAAHGFDFQKAKGRPLSRRVIFSRSNSFSTLTVATTDFNRPSPRRPRPLPGS